MGSTINDVSWRYMTVALFIIYIFHKHAPQSTNLDISIVPEDDYMLGVVYVVDGEGS